MAERRRHFRRHHLRIGSLVRGWRLEAALAIGLGLAGELASFVLGAAGDVLVIGSAILAWYGSDRVHDRLARALRDSSIGRAFRDQMLACGIGKLLPVLPEVLGVEKQTIGARLRLQLPAGLSIEDLEGFAPRLAAAARAREVRLAADPTDVSRVDVTVVYEEPFSRHEALSWEWRDAGSTSLAALVPIGVDEDGGPVAIALFEHNLLVGGEPGAGKSVLLSLLVAAAALDPTTSLSLLDPKQVELAPWLGCAEAFAGPTMGEAVAVLQAAQREMDARYERLLAERRRKIAPGGALGLHVVVIDELAWYLRAADRAERVAFTETLRDLVSRGRAAGIVVLAATQKPSHDVVPTAVRDLFAYRLALRCTSPEASDTILGQGWASQGFSASTIDPSTRGVGWLLAEGALPVRMRSAHLSDDDIDDLAARAIALRSGRRR